MSIDVTHAQQAFQLGLCRSEPGVRQSIHVLVMHVQLPWVENVLKVLDFVGESYARFQVHCVPGFAEAVQNRVSVFDVLFCVRGEDEYIVSVDEPNLPL